MVVVTFPIGVASSSHFGRDLPGLPSRDRSWRRPASVPATRTAGISYGVMPRLARRTFERSISTRRHRGAAIFPPTTTSTRRAHVLNRDDVARPDQLEAPLERSFSVNDRRPWTCGRRCSLSCVSFLDANEAHGCIPARARSYRHENVATPCAAALISSFSLKHAKRTSLDTGLPSTGRKSTSPPSVGTPTQLPSRRCRAPRRRTDIDCAARHGPNGGYEQGDGPRAHRETSRRIPPRGAAPGRLHRAGVVVGSILNARPAIGERSTPAFSPGP